MAESAIPVLGKKDQGCVHQIMSTSSVTNSPAASCFLSYKSVPRARLRLFCFPYAGGGALTYRTWPDLLPANVEMLAAQFPGHGNRIKESPYRQLEPLVESFAQAIVPFLSMPFAFFGHSMGAMIAFELARLLRREHRKEPASLFVSARQAPQFPESDPITYNLPEPEFIDELRRLNGTPREVLEQPELLQLMLPILRADFEVCQTYTYSNGPLLSCPISAFGGLQDEDVLREQLEAWREQSTSSFTLQMFPGDHFFLHTSQHLLLRTLSQQLHRLTQTI